MACIHGEPVHTALPSNVTYCMYVHMYLYGVSTMDMMCIIICIVLYILQHVTQGARKKIVLSICRLVKRPETLLEIEQVSKLVPCCNNYVYLV